MFTLNEKKDEIIENYSRFLAKDKLVYNSPMCFLLCSR